MLAPAETSANENHLQAEFETCIGIIPHQVSENNFCIKISFLPKDALFQFSLAVGTN